MPTKKAKRIVSRGELRVILREHSENPSRLRYHALQSSISRDAWKSLREDYQRWYAASSDGFSYELLPGSYDAFVVEE